MRDDAESLFVPAADLPEAALGDTVVVSSEADGPERTAAIVGTSTRDGQRFFRLEFCEP